jgi:hypothetical protein
VFLLDANALIALTVREHLSNPRVRAWFQSAPLEFATCPITQGALVRFHLRLNPAGGLDIAKAAIRSLESHPRHRFWHDDLSYTCLQEAGLHGHRQVTDFYLVALAKSRSARLATLDEPLAAWHTSSAFLIP